VLTIVIGIPLGILSAVHRGTMIDRGALMFALSGQAIPNFWFGVILIILFSVILGWLPSFGNQGFKSLIMPSLTLALAYTGVLTRVVRSSMIEVLDQDYIRTARAKGVRNQAVLYRHALRNASLPATTVLGLELGALLSGSVIVETVFAYPGVGWLAIQAIRAQDFPIILAFVAVMSVITLAITLAVDLLYAVLDPRVAYR
jgi:peptide/nickel transport system permease protein